MRPPKRAAETGCLSATPCASPPGGGDGLEPDAADVPALSPSRKCRLAASSRTLQCIDRGRMPSEGIDHRGSIGLREQQGPLSSVVRKALRVARLRSDYDAIYGPW